MIAPILFDASATTFTSNGMGRLADCASCRVTEELNGLYELELTCPISGRHFDDIRLQRLLLVKVSDGSMQPFRIYATSRPIDGLVAVRARHISYDLTKVVVKPSISVNNSAPAVFTQMLSKATPTPSYTFWTDISGSGKVESDVPISFRALIGDTGQQCMVNAFLGELEWDKFTIKLHEERGQNRHVSIRYGKNMTDISADLDADIYNTVVPYAKGTDDVMVVGDPVTYNSEAVNGIVPLDVSDQFDTTDGNTPSKSAVEAAGLRWLNKNKPWQNIREISVSMVGGDNTAALSKVLMGDTVEVHFAEQNIHENLRVIRTEWDCLRERYESVGLGDPLRLLSERLKTAQQKTSKGISKAQDTAQHVANGTYSGGSLVNNRTVSNAAIVGGTLDVGPISGSSPQDYNFRVDSSGNVVMSGDIKLKGSVYAYGNFTVLDKNAADTSTPVGHMGAATGNDGTGTTTEGVALSYSSTPDNLTANDSYVICTPNGVRLQSSGHNLYVVSSGAYADGQKIVTQADLTTAVDNAVSAALAAQQNNGGTP